MRKEFRLTFLLWVWSALLVAQNYSFRDTTLSDDARIDNLLSLMTLEEKVACLGTNPSVSRLGVEGTGHIEGLHGVAMGDPGNWGDGNPVPTTTFPQSYGMGQTWDTCLMRKMGVLEAYDMRYLYQNPNYKRGALVVRAPNADLGHDPRWGRTEECYGEDPFLVGAMATSFIKGLQGNHPRYWAGASLMKHFLANSNENTRAFSSSDFDERLLHEYYAYPFRKGVIDGGSRAYMAAYNKVNQVPMMVSPLLNELTIDQWGQNGIICTDGGALGLLISMHKYYDSIEMGAAMAVKSGINQFLDDYKEAINTALEKGMLTEADIDAVIKGSFRIMLKLGLLDDADTNPYAKIGLDDETEPWLSKEHKEVVLEATEKSIVLLKNEKNTLPINRKKVKKIAVIGWLADEVLLDWYSGNPPYAITPLEGIQEQFGKHIEITFASDSSLDQAVQLAREADLVLAFGGNHLTGNAGWEQVTRDSYGKEAVDRKSIQLEDETWIKKLYEVNQNTVLVLVSNFPYAINWSQHNLPAIVHMTHNSAEMGSALAHVLLGEYNPAGRLVQNWPMSDKFLPDIEDYNLRNGSTYLYAKYPPLYPFGYGLSYTQFEYSNLGVTQNDDELQVQVQVENIGKLKGDEVVQVYVHYPHSKVERPEKALKAFVRVPLKKGEQKPVTLSIQKEDLAYWNTIKQDFELEEGEIEIQVGASSTDIRLTQTIAIENAE